MQSLIVGSLYLWEYVVLGLLTQSKTCEAIRERDTQPNLSSHAGALPWWQAQARVHWRNQEERKCSLLGSSTRQRNAHSFLMTPTYQWEDGPSDAYHLWFVSVTEWVREGVAYNIQDFSEILVKILLLIIRHILSPQAKSSH